VLAAVPNRNVRCCECDSPALGFYPQQSAAYEHGGGLRGTFLPADTYRSAEGLFIQRNYYGVVRVLKLDEGKPSLQRYALVHGVTIHGYQFLSA